MKSIALFALFMTSAATTAPLPETRKHQHQEIYKAVNEFLASNYRQEGIDYQFQIKPLDYRLRLSKCSKPFEVFARDDGKPYGRVSIGVRCTGKRPWTIYTAVNIKAFGKVVVVKQSLPRGTAIKNDHLEQRKRDLSRLRRGYIVSSEEAVGMQTKRPVKAGKVLNLAQLDVPKTIKKGERIVIRASNGEIDVSMPGRALSDGRTGEQIRVRNESSERVVEGIILSKGVIEVAI